MPTEYEEHFIVITYASFSSIMLLKNGCMKLFGSRT